MTEDAALERLCRMAEADARVLAVLLYGSAARHDSGPGSDVDICLVLRSGERARPGEVRLHFLAEFDVDVQVFQELPLYVRSRVLRDGQVLLSKDDDALYAVALGAVREWEDFKPRYLQYLEAVANG